MKFFKIAFLSVALLFAAAATAQTGQIFLVEILFSGGQARIGEVTNGQGYASEPEKELELGPYQYWLELISSSGQVLESRKISLDPRIFHRPPYPGEEPEPAEIVREEFNKVVSLPLYPDVKLLYLYDANRNLLDQKDISYLLLGCGDGKCGEKENYLSCSQDCPAGGKDGWCNKGLGGTDPDCPKAKPAENTTAPEKRPPGGFYTLLTAGGLIILSLIAGSAAYIIKKRKAKSIFIGDNQ